MLPFEFYVENNCFSFRKKGTILALYGHIDKMSIKKKEIIYRHYPGIEALAPKDQILVQAAQEVLKKAYAPYSGFYVGCALRLEDGHIICGSNQENASYPLSLCAERVALLYAKSNFPNLAIETIAVVAHSSNQLPISPCGACRQVISEVQSRQAETIRLILHNGHSSCLLFEDANTLLPLSFGGEYLSKQQDDI